MTPEELARAKHALALYIRSLVDSAVRRIADGDIPGETVKNPFTGEPKTLRARPLAPGYKPVRDRLVGRRDRVPAKDLEMLRAAFAQFGAEFCASLAATVTREGMPIDGLQLDVRTPAGESLDEALYSLTPSTDEILTAERI